MAVRPLSLIEAEYIAHAAAIELMNFDGEPIPPFNSRSPGILESCLLEPFQTFGGKSLHYHFSKKAAILFYLCIKNHPFKNGNKRMAVILTSTFCYVNKRWLNITNDHMYRIATLVAESKPSSRDEIITLLEDGFKASIMPLSRFERLLNLR